MWPRVPEAVDAVAWDSFDFFFFKVKSFEFSHRMFGDEHDIFRDFHSSRRVTYRNVSDRVWKGRSVMAGE